MSSPGRGKSVVGQRLARPDAKVKATGEAAYTMDMTLPNLLHGRILRSPHPHARIVHIDASAARRLPGVKGVITGSDLAVGGTRATYGATPPDELPLAVDRVRFIGDEVAAVAAVDRDTASEALERIRVEYEPLPAVFNPEEAMAPDAPRLHHHAEGNRSWRLYQDRGDVDRGLQEAHHVQRDRFVTHSVCHAALEPHAALAQFGSDGTLTLWASTQRPFFVSLDIADALGMPESLVRVVMPHVGGGFGGKLETSAVEYSAAFLARGTGRPVKFVLDQEEVLAATRRRHAIVIELETGVKKDGTLTARSCRAILNGGAYNSLGVITCYLTAVFLNLPYRCPSIRYEALRIYTNNPPSGAMRGFGAPQMHFAVEVQMDMIAEALGMDPVELRLKNALRAGERTPSGLFIPSSGLEECIRAAAERSDWQAERRKRGNDRGVGMACNGFMSGPRLRRLPRDTDSYAIGSSILRAFGDGRVAVISGAADIGQGSDGMLAQVAAEELGIDHDRVRVMSGDTSVAPVDMGTFGSRVTMVAGNATVEAARDLKRKLLEAAGLELGLEVEQLQLQDGAVVERSTNERRMSFAEAVLLTQRRLGGRPVIGEGFFNPEVEGKLDVKELYAAGLGNYSPTYSFGAHVAEVSVDRETGRVRLERTTVAHDCGVAINPTSVEGQLHGCASMGAGYALSEAVDSRNGLMMNPSLLDYRVPLSIDAEPMDILLVDSHDPAGPFGAKEAGEGPISAVAPSIANAIHHAIGVWLKELPITPDRVLEALEQQAALAENGIPPRATTEP